MLHITTVTTAAKQLPIKSKADSTVAQVKNHLVAIQMQQSQIVLTFTRCALRLQYFSPSYLSLQVLRRWRLSVRGLKCEAQMEREFFSLQMKRRSASALRNWESQVRARGNAHVWARQHNCHWPDHLHSLQCLFTDFFPTKFQSIISFVLCVGFVWKQKCIYRQSQLELLILWCRKCEHSTRSHNLPL